MSGRDDAAPYVAPEDPNTGARTEPFRGPFEPPPGQPKVSEFVPSSSTLDDLDNLDAQDGEPARTAAPTRDSRNPGSALSCRSGACSSIASML